MKKCLFFAALAACAGGMTACARMPAQAEVASLQYGPPIAQEDAEAQAKAYLSKHLKDPYSAVFTWQKVDKGWVKAPPILGGGIDAGWVLKGTVNARNSFGGYVGARPYQFMFYNGSLSHVWAADNDGGILTKQM
ncbi:hypothetical protein [Luteibacter sp. E-22]|uniref:hypothetical protein n=1 Tax=Luteibacter sp. E-22 TaxID=3404050 RepID=UPI003CF8E8BD